MRETEASNYQQEQQKELLRKKKKSHILPAPPTGNSYEVFMLLP